MEQFMAYVLKKNGHKIIENKHCECHNNGRSFAKGNGLDKSENMNKKYPKDLIKSHICIH